MARRRFEFSSGTSNKFWEVASTATEYTLSWGRIGTAGNSKTKKTPNAAKEVAALIAEKQGKGYREVSKRTRQTSSKPARRKASTKASARVATVKSKAKDASSDTKSDRARLRDAFRALRKHGYVADGPLGNTPSDGWTDVYERSGDSDAPAVFFTSETGRAFEGDKLGRKLPLQWRGDAKLIVETLGKHGFRPSIPDSEGEAISIVAGPARKWPANAKLTKVQPRATESDKKQQYARFAKGLRALRKDGWKVRLKHRVRFSDEPPPAKTISVDAPALWLLPDEVERLAKLWEKPTAVIRFYVGGKRERVLTTLTKAGVDASPSEIIDWAVDVVLKA